MLVQKNVGLFSKRRQNSHKTQCLQICIFFLIRTDLLLLFALLDFQVSSFSNSSHNQCLQTASKPLTQNHVNHHMTSDSQLPHVSLSCKSFTPFNGTCDEDRSSLASQDSGIPTLEINPPEHIHARVTTAELVVPPPHDDSPATLNLDVSDSSILKSSTFPRCDFDLVRPYGAGGLSSAAGKGTFNRSDDISVCSVSSLSTEFSATLSVSNEDFLDFMVTSESSAVVTFENEDVLHRSNNSLSSPTDLHGKLSSPQWHPVGVSTPHEARPKRLGPLASFFHRYRSVCICNGVNDLFSSIMLMIV